MEGEKREEWRRERWVPSMKSQPNHWRVSFLSLITRPMARSSPETNLHVYYIIATQSFPSLSTVLLFQHMHLCSRKLTCQLYFGVYTHTLFDRNNILMMMVFSKCCESELADKRLSVAHTESVGQDEGDLQSHTSPSSFALHKTNLYYKH